MTMPAEDEFTELVDADIPRVDLVDRAANGITRFLIAKSEGGPTGLLDPGYVRDLIGKAGPEPESAGETVTLTGSPAAMAKMIHQAAQRHTDNWNTHGLKEGSVSKMELDDSTDGMDPTVTLAAPEEEAPGDPMDPGSPAWEAIDAATACKWTSILARAKAAIDVLAQREMLEAASGDEGDAENAMDLDDACCAIDYAISVLAPFAVAEQSEADMAADVMAAVGKALGEWDPAPLDTIEAFGVVRKAGRVLSSANEAAIRGAVESLQKVLASLPAAPVVPEAGTPVTKEQTVPATEETTPAVVEKTTDEPAAQAPQEPVAKADGEKVPQVAVYDAKGKLVGIVDPTDITPISGADAEPDAEPEPEAAAPAEPVTEATDLAPAPAAEAGTPADAVPDDVTKTTVPDTTQPVTGTDNVLKSITEAVTAAFAANSAAQQEVIAKQAADLAGLAESVETLKGRLAVVEEQPAPPKVFTNGAVPQPQQLRGQDRGATPVDLAKAKEQRDSLYKSYDATEQNRIAAKMQADAIGALEAIHQRRAPR